MSLGVVEAGYFALASGKRNSFAGIASGGYIAASSSGLRVCMCAPGSQHRR